jgi:fibronectin type 3 domain-containing protein
MEDKLADSMQITWHSYQVTARMGTLTTTACIAAPTNVSAGDGAQENIQITWSAVSGASRYRLYRSTSNDFGVSEALTGWQTATAYTDSNSVPLTAYYYWVRASSDSTGQCASVASGSDVGWSKLRPPTGVAASDGTTTAGVQITWDAALSAAYYRVYRNDVDNPSLAIPISSWQTELTYLDSSSAASPGVSRYYWVCSAASNSGQAASGFSVSDSGYRKLAAPTNALASQGTYDNHVRITWSSVPGATHYRVFRNTVNNPMEAMGVGPWVTTTTCDDTTAEPCVTYYYWVQAAVSSTGSRTSDLSTEVTGWRPMPVPTNFSASDGTFTDYCRITWNAVAGATHYRVWQSMTNDPATAQAISSWQTNTFHNDSNGHRGRIYYYWVAAAKDANGLCASPKSASDSGWQGLLPPNCVNASDGESIDHVYVGWCSSDYDIYHKVYRGPTSNPAAAVAITGWIDSPYYEDASGNLGEEYYYFVKAAMAADGTGESDFSIGDLGWREVPTPMNIVAGDGTSSSYVCVSWSSSATGLWYQVYRGTSSNPKASIAISQWLLDTTSFDDTGAIAAETYYYWVKAAADDSGTGASDPGGPDTGWRGLAGPNPTASDGTYTDRVAVNWTVVPGSSYFFRVYRASSGGTAGAVALGDWQAGSTFSDATAFPGVYYYYWVKVALNAAGDRASEFGRSNRGHRALDCNNNGVPDSQEPDADADGVPDVCDLCSNTVPGSPVDPEGCPPAIPGDFDRDGDVDADDFGVFASCGSGPAIPRTSGCSGADFDHDFDVDHCDFGYFQRCWSGENNPGEANCAD